MKNGRCGGRKRETPLLFFSLLLLSGIEVFSSFVSTTFEGSYSFFSQSCPVKFNSLIIPSNCLKPSSTEANAWKTCVNSLTLSLFPWWMTCLNICKIQDSWKRLIWYFDTIQCNSRHSNTIQPNKTLEKQLNPFKCRETVPHIFTYLNIYTWNENVWKIIKRITVPQFVGCSVATHELLVSN